jgi:ATP-dependent DNA helicase RecG
MYPFNAFREGLVNALVHRDYAAFSGSVSVSIYPDRIEIWNTGRLPRGISPRDLLLVSHPSILVNPDIGHVFYLHELMERVGRGTYKIAQECRDFGMRVPEWKNVGTGVRLTLYAARGDHPARPDLNDRQRELLAALGTGEQIRVPEYVERFGRGITTRQARLDLSDLEGYGFLVRHGAGPKTAYERTGQML